MVQSTKISEGLKPRKSVSSVYNCFGHPSLLVEGLLSTGATSPSFYLLVELGLLLHLFKAYVLITGPALYKKTPPKRLEINLFMCRPDSDVFRIIFRLPAQKKS